MLILGDQLFQSVVVRCILERVNLARHTLTFLRLLKTTMSLEAEGDYDTVVNYSLSHVQALGMFEVSCIG